MEELLEIKEFAERAGISRQSVYKAYHNPNSRLQPYVISTPKGPRIKAQALVDIYDNQKQPKETTADTLIQPDSPRETTQTASNQFAVDNHKQPVSTHPDNQAGAVAAVLDTLKAQLQEKDKQIERLQLEAQALQRAGAEKDKFIQEQSKQLALLLAQSQELQRNNQILLGAAHRAAQRTEDTPVEKGLDLNAEPQATQEAQEPKKEKKSFFKWLFD